MNKGIESETLLDMYIFESTDQLEKLESIALQSEQDNSIQRQLNEVFRLIHSLKGSSAVMNFMNIVELTHTLEDIFYFLRNNDEVNADYSLLTDIVLKSVDFIKNEIASIQSGEMPDGNITELVLEVKYFLTELSGECEKDSDKEQIEEIEEIVIDMDISIDEKQLKAVVFFDDGCEMENVRAFNIIYHIEKVINIIGYYPENIEDQATIDYIRKNGFTIHLSTNLDMNKVMEILESTLFVREVRLETVETEGLYKADIFAPGMDVLGKDVLSKETLSKEVLSKEVLSKEVSNKEVSNKEVLNKEVSNKEISNKEVLSKEAIKKEAPAEQKRTEADKSDVNAKQSMVSVSLDKMDRLLDLVGELVISQAMVIQNPELKDLELKSFHKATRQLQLVTNDIQDAVMSLRMVSLSMTFHKMTRIVRDMGKNLNKEINLSLIGENTEVDRNIIEHLSDPLLHLVRNAADHGIEDPLTRVMEGKSSAGTITLEAKNDGGDVKIIVKDDGRGLDKSKILEKAKQKQLLKKPETEYTDKDIYSFILMPGFSTNEDVTEYSGRGVGMDVVNKNIDELGGSIQIDSCIGKYTSFILKIPLTLAIIEGMKMRIGNSVFTVPITSIKRSFRVTKEKLIFNDSSNGKMIMINGECYPLLKLGEYFNTSADADRLEDGIIVIVENETKAICLFADELLGVEQVVIKALPDYISKKKGISSCTLMANGNISLIIDVPDLFENV